MAMALSQAPCVEAERAGEVWRRGTYRQKHFSRCAGHYTCHGGPERVSERRCSSKKVCLCLHREMNPIAEPRCPHTPTRIVSCKRTREAASSRAAAVGEAISSTERTSSHLAACRVRVRAEITAPRPCRGLALCRHCLISPHSPHNTFVCPS